MSIIRRLRTILLAYVALTYVMTFLTMPVFMSVHGEYSTAKHDIAITGASPSRIVVDAGENITIYVTIENQGDFTEAFTIWTFCGFHQNFTLTAYTSTKIDYTLNTSRLAKGRYRVWAYVPPCFGDEDPTNNCYVGGSFWIGIIDITGDGKVNIRDIILAALAFGSYPGRPNWNPNADINGDGKVNIKDIVLMALQFGKTDP